jgi:putative SOS response-associated peptidase YedK
MCGRYELALYPWMLAYYGVPLLPSLPSNADLRPTDTGAIVRLDEAGGRECIAARWGLIPSWARDIHFGRKCFNARAETIDTTPAFRAAFSMRRCLVPAAAFFEWTGPAGHKVKHRITRPDGAPVTLAGVWERWRDPAGGQVISYTVATCDPSAQMRALHDRMPVVLDPSDFARWLQEPAKDLLKPYAGPLLIDPPAN